MNVLRRCQAQGEALWLHLCEALRNATCSVCETPLAPPTLICKGCKMKLGFLPPHPFRFEGQNASPVYAATMFNPEIKALIYGYKFKKRGGWGHVDGLLSDLLIEAARQGPLTELTPDSVIVTTIPGRRSSSSRSPEQSARRLARKMRWRYRPHLLQWMRPTEQQHNLKHRSERMVNLIHSLALNPTAISRLGLNANSSPPRMIVVVDDLTTTGATFREAFRALSQPICEGQNRLFDQLAGFAVSGVPSPNLRRPQPHWKDSMI